MDKWLTMHFSVLEELIHRAHEGEDPELLIVEFYANCEREDH